MIFLIPLAVIIIAIVIFFFFPRHKKPQNPPYIEALHRLLDGKTDQAIGYLKEAVKVDTDNIEAYLRLGDLLREKGEVEKALRIHQSLTVRHKLSKFDERRIFKSLALDYLASGRHNRGLSLLKDLVKQKPKDKDTLKILLSVFEQNDLFSEAIEFLKSGAKKFVDKKTLAIYHLKVGQMIYDDDPKEARNYFKKALRLAPKSPLVLYSLGEHQLKSGKNDEAIESWEELLLEYPDMLILIQGKLENALFESKRFHEIETLYEKVLHKHQYNIPIALALIRIYKKKNELDKLKSLVDRLKEYQPGLLLPKLIEIRLNLDTGPAAKLIDEIIEAGEKHQFRCSVCGFEKEDLEWRCPHCGAWESFQLFYS